MKISEIQGNQGDINIEADVMEVGETRTLEKNEKTLRVANAIIKDDSGTCKLTLWNDEIGKINKGDRVKITKGYARQFREEIQLTAGKFGKMEVIGKAEVSQTPQSKPEEDVFSDEEEW